MAEDLGMAINFYRRGDASDLADKMIALLSSPQLQRDTAEQNFSVALRMTMPAVIRQYLRSFERKHAMKSLQAIGRFRRVPPWAPMRSVLFNPKKQKVIF